MAAKDAIEKYSNNYFQNNVNVTNALTLKKGKNVIINKKGELIGFTDIILEQNILYKSWDACQALEMEIKQVFLSIVSFLRICICN